MRAELKETEVATDGIDEGGKSSYQPPSDEDNGDEEECNDIGRLSRLRDPKKIQLFFCHVLASDPTGMALRGLLRDMELWDVHMNENYFKTLCDWKLKIGTVDYDALKIPRVIPDTARLEQYGSEVQRYAGGLEKYALSLIDVVAVIFAILNVLDGQQLPIRPLLNYAVDTCPELILIGAVQLETPWMPIEFDAINDLLDVYYRSEDRVPRLFVLGTLWQVNRDALTSFLVEKYKLQPMEIHQIAQLITDLGVAPSLVNVRPHKFALDLYTNLSVRGEFSISRYLTSVTNSTGVEFTIDMLDFLDDLINDSSKRCTIGLTEVSEFMRVLSELSIPLSYIDRWHRVREQCVVAYPRLVVFGRGLELIIIFNQNLSSEFSDSIIAEVDAKIEDLRSFQVHVFESIEYLKVLHKSTSPISQDLVARMMSLIFERNMNLVGLPLEDVAMFSTLLGLLIKNRLIVGTHLTVALERIVRSLSNYPPESTVFKAALNTAMHVVDALDICPYQFCDTLAGLDDLANFAPDLWRVARDTRVRRNLAMEYGSAATHIGQECFEIPVQVSKQKIHDILQSLSTDTVPMVVNELGAILNDETCSNWFVDYLVGTLISHKLSQHDTYLELLTAIKSDELNSMVLRRTFNFSLTLIKSEETVHLTSELAKVSNLGTWLGKYTLRRNKPIKANHICFKKLLRLGDEIGRLSVVVGFTCRVLEQAAKSIVFTASNAWVIGVLRALLEVFEYKIGDATWKDDIKALFKTLRADMQNVAAAARAEHARVADFHTDDLIANFELLSKRIDKKVAQIRGLVKNTVDAMWHKCMGCIEPPPACMLVLINCIEELIEALLSEGLESAVALEDARKKIEEGAGNCRDEIYKQNIEQQAAAHFSAYLERNGYSYVTSHQTNVLEKAMDAVRTHLYELIYNKITEEVNRSMLVMMRGTAFSPLKLRTTRDIHHPGQSEAEKISSVRAEADGDIREVVEITDSPKKRPDVFPAGRNDDRDEFSMMRDIVDRILSRICLSSAGPDSGPYELPPEKIDKYVKRFAAKLARTSSPKPAQLIEYALCKLVKDAKTAQAREAMCKIVAQLCLWSQNADKYVESWLSSNFEDLTSNRLVVPALLRNQLIHANRLDSVICSWLEKFNSTKSVRFVASLVCDLIAGYPRLAELQDFSTTLDLLHRVCTGPTFHIPQSIIAISMDMDNNQQSTASEIDGMRSAFKAWIELTAKQPRSAAQESDSLRRLILRGMFDESRNLDAFFRPALGYCVQLYHDANDHASELMREEGYKAVCGLADLVVRAYEFSELGDTCSRLFIVNHIFANVLAFVMHISQTGEVKDKLDGRPYYYFFMHTLQLLHDSVELDCEAKRGLYIYLADCFYFIRPTECLFFVVLWTKLVSDEQLFVNHMLEDEESTGMLVELLCSGMSFIGKYLRASGMYALVRDVDIMLQTVFVSLARARPDFMATHKGRFTDAVDEWQDGNPRITM